MKTYNLPNFANPITPESIEVRAVAISLISNTVQIEVALKIGDNTYVHSSDQISFDGDWRKLDLLYLANQELQQYESTEV
jgi:hypothetical protein